MFFERLFQMLLANGNGTRARQMEFSASLEFCFATIGSSTCEARDSVWREVRARWAVSESTHVCLLFMGWTISGDGDGMKRQRNATMWREKRAPASTTRALEIFASFSPVSHSWTSSWGAPLLTLACQEPWKLKPCAYLYLPPTFEPDEKSDGHKLYFTPETPPVPYRSIISSIRVARC